MRTTDNYELKIYEGTDVFNPLVVENANTEAIDEALKDNADASVGLATELLNGTVHALTRANEDASMFRFVATADYNLGDTFTIDGVQVTAKLPTGETPGQGAYVINSNVLCCLVGTLLTIYTTGSTTIAQDSEKLGGELPSYYGTASDTSTALSTAQNANTIALAVQSALSDINIRYNQLTDFIQIKDSLGEWHNWKSGGLSLIDFNDFALNDWVTNNVQSFSINPFSAQSKTNGTATVVLAEGVTLTGKSSITLSGTFKGHQQGESSSYLQFIILDNNDTEVLNYKFTSDINDREYQGTFTVPINLEGEYKVGFRLKGYSGSLWSKAVVNTFTAQ